MVFSFLKFHWKHKKGGIFCRRYVRKRWKLILASALVLFLLLGYAQYRNYVYFTRPINIPANDLVKNIVNLDSTGLDKAVQDIKTKEQLFVQYLQERVQIVDPGR